MKEVFDFMINALPWIAIGLLVVCSCVTVHAKNNGNEMSKLFKVICWSPALCFLFVAIMEMLNGNKSSGTTWLVLSVFNAVIYFASAQEENR